MLFTYLPIKQGRCIVVDAEQILSTQECHAPFAGTLQNVLQYTSLH